MHALDLLTGDAQTFRAEVWASRMHLHRTDPAALTRLLSLADADRLLTGSGIRTPALRIVKDGTIVPEKQYEAKATMTGRPITGLVDGRKALALWDAGATIVFQGLHRYWPPLTALIQRLETELGHPCQANAYLTPPGNQGFAVHADTHDVFVVQTAGRKLWELHGLDPEQPDAVHELTLEPGLALYLPTGTRHAARAQDSLSLHVTIGINQLTMRGLVERTVKRALAEVPNRHLPAGFLDDPGPLADELATELEALAARIRALSAPDAVDAEIRRRLTTRAPRVVGGLLDREALPGLGDHTRLTRRPGHPVVLRDRPTTSADAADTVDVLLGDRVLTIPAWVRPALDEIGRREALTPSDLAPYLDEQSRLVLCRRLVREGLLRVDRS